MLSSYSPELALTQIPQWDRRQVGDGRGLSVTPVVTVVKGFLEGNKQFTFNHLCSCCVPGAKSQRQSRPCLSGIVSTANAIPCKWPRMSERQP